MKLTKTSMTTLSDEVVSGLSECFDSTRWFEKNLETFYGDFSSDRLNYCLDKLIETEFDSKTKGNRGLGRVSNDPPRLAGYLRYRVSKLNQSETDHLKTSVKRLMLKCYLFMVSRMENKRVSHSTNKDALFNEWLPEVYLFNLYNLGENTVDILFSLVQRDYELLKVSLQALDTMPTSYGDEVISKIVSGYASAGVVLALADQGLAEN